MTREVPTSPKPAAQHQPLTSAINRQTARSSEHGRILKKIAISDPFPILTDQSKELMAPSQSKDHMELWKINRWKNSPLNLVALLTFLRQHTLEARDLRSPGRMLLLPQAISVPRV
ncbi:hypothetical protein TNCV_3703751 [Trichonephila clavipes]|nr:hypothetical protein TNCV_3703751 [Trichonephila clavipes]